MNKKQNYSAILAGIAVTAILVASSIIAGNQFTQQAHAQANTTSSTPSTPTTPRSAGTQQQVRVGQTVNWQGTVSSIPSPLAGHTRDNVAIVLPLRNDGGLYTGVITFTASKGVQVQVWNVLSGVSPTTTIGRDFGELAISPSPNGKGFVATTEVGGGGRGDTSGSVPFTGNAVALVGRSPFIATYSLTAQATAGKVTNNLTSATALAAAAAGGSLGGAAAPPTLGGATGAAGGASALGGESSGSALGGGPSGGSSSSGGGGSSSSGGGGSSGRSSDDGGSSGRSSDDGGSSG
ncbi:MAG: hypothetical protein ACJ72J_06740 [Nitrososphaeraceae archaeon]